MNRYTPISIALVAVVFIMSVILSSTDGVTWQFILTIVLSTLLTAFVINWMGLVLEYLDNKKEE